MPPRFDDEHEDEDDFNDSDEDDEPTIPCPYCKRSIHEDAQRCPYCEKYVSDEDARATTKPWWIILGALVCLYVVYRWIVAN